MTNGLQTNKDIAQFNNYLIYDSSLQADEVSNCNVRPKEGKRSRTAMWSGIVSDTLAKL